MHNILYKNKINTINSKSSNDTKGICIVKSVMLKIVVESFVYLVQSYENPLIQISKSVVTLL